MLAHPPPPSPEVGVGVGVRVGVGVAVAVGVGVGVPLQSISYFTYASSKFTSSLILTTNEYVPAARVTLPDASFHGSVCALPPAGKVTVFVVATTVPTVPVP